MKTRCRDCRCLIDFGLTRCEKCTTKFNMNRKSGLKDKEAEKHSKSGRWKCVRKKVIQRDKGVCVNCYNNKRVEYRGLQVHHIIKRTQDLSKAYDMDNLVTLCRKCHEEFEEMPIAKQKELLGDFNKEELHFLL